MKKQETYFFALGLSCLGMVFAPLAPAMATSENTVSAVGVPTAPAPITDMPDATSAEEFPPQPVTVAPAEVASPAIATTTPSAPPVAAPNEPLTPVMQQPADGSVRGTNVMGDSGAQQRHSGTYYDANAIVPDRDLAAAGAVGPRKVDPALEPGQRFVVVEKAGAASSIESQYIAATRALKLGRYAAAMEMFEKLYRRNHKDPRILMGLAVAQQGAGFRESAIRTYEDLLKLQPNNADAIVNLMGIMSSQYPSVTLKKLTELRGKYPTNPGIPAQMGLVSADLNNYDDAIRYLEVAASMDPKNPSHIYNMAIVSDREGKVARAIQLYEQALQLDAAYGNSASSLPREQIYDRLVVLRRKA